MSKQTFRWKPNSFAKYLYSKQRKTMDKIEWIQSNTKENQKFSLKRVPLNLWVKNNALCNTRSLGAPPGPDF